METTNAPEFIRWALLFVMMEVETGITPDNQEYNSMWNDFENKWSGLQKQQSKQAKK